MSCSGILLASPKLNLKKVKHHSDREFNGEFDGTEMFDLAPCLHSVLSAQSEEVPKGTKKVLCLGKRLSFGAIL